MEGHDITLRGDRWFCETEDVDANDCTDENRCMTECCCNYTATIIVAVQVRGDDIEVDNLAGEAASLLEELTPSASILYANAHAGPAAALMQRLDRLPDRVSVDA